MNERNTIFKWLIFVALVAASVVCVTPVSQKVRLGLDLAGGMSFTAQIDEEALRADLKASDETLDDKAIDSQVEAIMNGADERTVEVIRNRIDGLGVNEPLIVPGKDHRIVPYFYPGEKNGVNFRGLDRRLWCKRETQ